MKIYSYLYRFLAGSGIASLKKNVQCKGSNDSRTEWQNIENPFYLYRLAADLALKMASWEE